MSKSLDRVQKWGELLAELSETNRTSRKNTQSRVFKNRQEIIANYLSLEEKAKNFQIEELRNKLNESIKSGTSSPKTVLSHTLRLDRHGNYKYLILGAFKTKFFLIEIIKNLPSDILMLLVRTFAFLRNICIGMGIVWSLIFLARIVWHLPQVEASNLLERLLIISGVILCLFFTIAFLTAALFFIYVIGECLISFFEEDILMFPGLLDISNIIRITNHRQIKLSELRLLFLEFEKFQLKPELLITSNVLSKARKERIGRRIFRSKKLASAKDSPDSITFQLVINNANFMRLLKEID